MGVYSKVVSTVKPINSIRTFIGGVAKDITSAWVFVNGVRKQVFPTTEVWTQVYSNGTPGNYSQTLGFGKYRVVLSGGGGAGGVAAKSVAGGGGVTARAGSAAEQIEFYFNVGDGENQTVSGKIGAGAAKSHIRLNDNVAEAGTPGAGYANGTSGEAHDGNQEACVAGSGGGSSNATIGGTNRIARGGNGGNAKDSTVLQPMAPGAGGSGGYVNGTGAPGGDGHAVMAAIPATNYYSNPGSDGYIRIYKSNIYPE